MARIRKEPRTEFIGKNNMLYLNLFAVPIIEYGMDRKLK